MSLKSAKYITKRSWDTIPIPDTVAARVNQLACNKPNQFIFTDRRGPPIGYGKIARVDKDADDSNKNQAPEDPPHKFQAT